MRLRRKVFQFLLLSAILLLITGFSHAQTARSVDLTWQDSKNPTGTVYNVYRASGSCTGTPTFQTLVSSVTTKSYSDTTVKTGETWCYEVTAVNSGLESSPSNTAQATVGPFPPSSLVQKVN